MLRISFEQDVLGVCGRPALCCDFGVAVWPHECAPDGFLGGGVEAFVVAVEFAGADFEAEFDLADLGLAVGAGIGELAGAVGRWGGAVAVWPQFGDVEQAAGKFVDFGLNQAVELAGVLAKAADATRIAEAVELGGELALGFAEADEALAVGLVKFEDGRLFGEEGEAVVGKQRYEANPAVEMDVPNGVVEGLGAVVVVATEVLGQGLEFVGHGGLGRW
jgi:hypothetical protein